MNNSRGLRKRGKYYYARYSDGTGRIREESTKCTSKKDAMVFLEERHKQVRDGNLFEINRFPDMLFKEYRGKFLELVEGQKDFRNKLFFSKRLSAEFGNTPIGKINKLQVDSFIAKMQKENLKPASINRILAVLKHMYSLAYDYDYIGENTYKQIKKVKLLPVDNRRLRYLTSAECIRLIDSCDIHVKPIIVMAINTGMRLSEILNLEWNNVNLDDGFIQVANSKNNESRLIPINNTLRETLHDLPRNKKISHVFFNPMTKKPYTEIKKSFTTACTKAKIKNCTFHTLRHTFASLLVMEGVDLTTVKELMGHKDIKMTLRYAHLAKSHKENSVSKLDRLFPSGQKVGNFEEWTEDDVS